MPFHGRSPIERLSPSYTPYFLLRFLHGLGRPITTDPLIELQPKPARNQSGITLSRCLSPTIPLTVELRPLVRTMQVQPESPFIASWLPQAYTRLCPASAR